MKTVINGIERDLLDALAVQAGALAKAAAANAAATLEIRHAQRQLTEAIHRLLLVDAWDTHKRDDVAEYVNGGAGPYTLEQFLEAIGVALVDPLNP